MSKRRWLGVLALFLIPLIAAYGISLTYLGSRELRIGIELDTLLLVVGIIVSSVLAAVLVIRSRESRSVQEAVAQSQFEASEERRRFLRRLDHELKNPLTAIRAGLANLDSADRDERWSETRTSVESQILRLSRLTSDLRKLADLESRPLGESSLIDMGELLGEAFEAAGERPKAQDRSMTLTLPKAPWPLPQVQGDRDLLFLALFNLLDNALKFTGSGDTVEVRAFEDGANVVVEVADTGIGIPKKEVRHVWEELYRGQEARGVPGSGLGLSLVRAIVERHGGQTELRSKTKHGTVITVRLPVGR
ncbi:MAG: sensor histidine kinase [Anaerolineales bacterium]